MHKVFGLPAHSTRCRPAEQLYTAGQAATRQADSSDNESQKKIKICLLLIQFSNGRQISTGNKLSSIFFSSIVVFI